MIDVVTGVTVDASLVDSGIADDGQLVVALVCGVFVENHLHLIRPFDYELLTGLATAIGGSRLEKLRAIAAWGQSPVAFPNGSYSVISHVSHRKSITNAIFLLASLFRITL